MVPQLRVSKGFYSATGLLLQELGTGKWFDLVDIWFYKSGVSKGLDSARGVVLQEVRV